MKSLQKEEYSAAKAELLSTINLQFTILSILVTTTAAVFVYLFKKDTHQIGLCSCLIIPGIYAFFGILWLDQVYRQRRLAAYIYRIESSDGKDPNGLVTGWEHFIQESRLKKQENRPSRYYYYICLALFFLFPPVTVVLSCIYKVGNVFSADSTLKLPAAVGIFLYVVFIVVAFLYIRSINCLAAAFSQIQKEKQA